MKRFISILLVVIICFTICACGKNKPQAAEVTPTLAPVVTVAPTQTPVPTPIPTQKPVQFMITKNPTPETRDIGLTNQSNMLFVANATNYQTITWYIDNRPAANSGTVSGQGTSTLSINPYYYNNGNPFTVSVYAVFGSGINQLNTSVVQATVINSKPSPTPTPAPRAYSIRINNYGEGGYIAFAPTSACAGDYVKFVLNPTNSQAYYDVIVRSQFGLVDWDVSGVEYGFVMPDSDVTITVNWSIPDPVVPDPVEPQIIIHPEE